MKRLNGYRMRLIAVGIVAAIVVGGGRVKADFTFGEPVNLGPTVNTSADELTPCISSDGLELYFGSDRPGSLGSNYNIWVAKRASASDPWEAPMNPGSPLNYPGCLNCPYCLSVDGLELYFVGYNRPGGYGSFDLWVTRRATKNDAWGEPENLGPTINRSSYDDGQWISSDGLELYFHSDRSGGIGSFDIWVSRRATKNDPWTEPINLGATVNSSARDAYPCLSADGRLLLFSGLDYRTPYRPGGLGGSDIWMTKRASISDPWGTPVNLGPIINSSSGEEDPRLSSDGSTMYFYSNRPGGYGGARWGDIYQSQIIPIVDLNGDGIVDAADMVIMVDNWGTDNSLCDIGPMPLGDGIVDIKDLKVLAEHLFEDYRLVAHWKLDETEGDIAYDSIGANNATVHGEFLWQPTSGKDAGALEINGFISTPFVLNPGKGSLSAFALIKGGSPGQVIISQIGDFGDTWLCIDPSGKLLTELGSMYFGVLTSETIVTDDQWHHVGLVYDMDKLHRLLYVDGVMEAEDTTFVASTISEGGLYIGASKDFEADSFFSGLIDDVRIYNNVLSAEEIAALAQ